MQDYGKIAVVAGGPSSEREISLRSGKAVYEALKKRKGAVDFLDVGSDFRERLGELEGAVVFLALHGRFGEDGTVQDMLEREGIPYTGSGVKASRLAMDKIISRELFLANGLKAPAFSVAGKDTDAVNIAKGFKIPFVIKPRYEGSSIGLSIIRDKKEMAPALKKAFAYGDEVLVEEYIHGRELTVGILEDEPLPVIEIATRHGVYDFDAKYFDGDTRYILPAELPEDDYNRTQECGLRAYQALGCRDFSRVDMRMDKSGEAYVLEVNTIPGMTERSLLPKAAEASGIGFEDLCVKLIDLADKRRKRHGKK
jgi:D-alanine-D-alanine ligase